VENFNLFLAVKMMNMKKQIFPISFFLGLGIINYICRSVIFKDMQASQE
jgi:hypothetical protein